MYKRVLLKLSGEMLAGDFEAGIDPHVAEYYAKQIKNIADQGCEVVVVVGGGNLIRGSEVVGHGIRRVTGDHMGMLSGMINALAMTDIFEANGIPTRCLSNIFADQVAEVYSFRRADKHLAQGRVVIVAAGIGRPYFTHDTAAVNIALELGCEVVLKATKVDGVYDKDPAKHTTAVRFDKLSHQEAISNIDIKVMDRAALGLAMEQNMPVIVYQANNDTALAEIVAGKPVGTMVG